MPSSSCLCKIHNEMFNVSDIISTKMCSAAKKSLRISPPSVYHGLDRWKRLVRRGGKGGLIVERRTRLCSRHFDKQSIGEGDPKYFAWNNWGNPIKSRSLPVLRHIQKENEVVGCVHTLSSDQTVPGVGREVTVDTCLPKREIGSMYRPYILKGYLYNLELL